MLDLSPTKLLVIFIVVVIVLGPKRLPQVARQLGAGWRRLKNLSERVDQEVRQNVPDLPSSRDIVRYARSPAALLDQLASSLPDDHDRVTAAAEEDGSPRLATEPGDARYADGQVLAEVTDDPMVGAPAGPDGRASGPFAAHPEVSGTNGTNGKHDLAWAWEGSGLAYPSDDPSMN